MKTIARIALSFRFLLTSLATIAFGMGMQ